MQYEHAIIPTVSQLNTNFTKTIWVDNDEYSFHLIYKLVVFIEVLHTGQMIKILAVTYQELSRIVQNRVAAISRLIDKLVKVN